MTISTNERAVTSTLDMRHPRYPWLIYAGIRAGGIARSDRFEWYESIDDPSLVIHKATEAHVTRS